MDNNFLIINENKEKVVLDFNEINETEYCVQVNSRVKTEIIFKNPAKLKDFSIFISENANVVLKIISSDEIENYNFKAMLYDNSSLNIYAVDFSNSNKKIKANIILFGKYSSSAWNLSSFTYNDDKKIYDISFDHIGEHSSSLMENYGVASDKSTLFFEGCSHVEVTGVKASAIQKAKIIIYDKECIAKANPVFKIDYNDITANHAATVGTLNEDHVFYLLSRGISERNAKKLITLGYLTSNFKFFSEEEIKYFNNKLEEKF